MVLWNNDADLLFTRPVDSWCSTAKSRPERCVARRVRGCFFPYSWLYSLAGNDDSNAQAVFGVRQATKGPAGDVPTTQAAHSASSSQIFAGCVALLSIFSMYPHIALLSPVAKFRPSFLERRRQQLSFWLATVLLQPELGGSGIVRSFVLA